MTARLGNVLLWASILIAVAIIYAGYGVIPDDMGMAYAALLTGWACKYVLRGE
ncbi:MAG: hypothetical protein WCD69_29180 [Xanthobacteraceae bacterium]